MKAVNNLVLILLITLGSNTINGQVKDNTDNNSSSSIQPQKKINKISFWHRHKNNKNTPDTLEINNDNIIIEEKVEPHYDYLDENYIRSVIADGSRYVLVGTGWSESSLGKMNVNNQEKQKRAVALSLAQMMKIEQLGGAGRLIYLTTAPINPYYRRYLYRIANQSTLAHMDDSEVERKYSAFEKNFLRVVYLSPKGRDKLNPDRTRYLSVNANAFRKIKLPKALISLRYDKYTPNKFVGFTAHFSGPYLENMANEWELPYLVNPSAHAHWIKKSKSRQSFRNAGVRHAMGTYEPAFSKEALVTDIYWLLSKIKGRKIILKLDESAAGYGNKVLRFDEITKNLSEKQAKKLIMARLNDKEIFPDKFIARIEEPNGGAIIEEFIDCKNYASPASIYMIKGENDVTLHYTYDQLLGGLDAMVFQGSLGPIAKTEGNIGKMSEQIGNYLSTQGVRGNVGTDFVVCDADQKGQKRIAYAIENNVRMTGTSYPYYTFRTMLGVEQMKRKYLKSFDDVKIPKISARAFREPLVKQFYQDFLRNHPDTLNLETGRGCLVHNDIFRIGKLGLACVGDSKTDVIKIYESFIKSIITYVENHPITDAFKRYQESNEVQAWQERLNHLKTTAQFLLGEKNGADKLIESFYNDKEPLIISEAFDNSALQIDFFNQFLENHPNILNTTTQRGCLVNTDLFRSGKLGIVCVGDSSSDIINQHQLISQDIRQYLSQDQSFMPETNE